MFSPTPYSSISIFIPVLYGVNLPSATEITSSGIISGMKKTFTGGGVVVGTDNKIVVVSQNGNSWSLPKGHIDPGEDARTAAVREIQEETGIKQLTYIQDLGTYERFRIGINGSEEVHELKSITVFLYTTEETVLKPEDPANPEARWVEVDKVTDLLTHAKDKEFFNSIVPAIRDFLSKP